MCWTIVSEIFQIAINLCIWNAAPCPISPTHTAHSSLVLTSVLSPGPCTLLQWPELKVSAYTSAPTRVAFDKSRRDLSRLFAKLKKTRFENLMRLTICLFWWQLVVDNNTRAFILDMLFYRGYYTRGSHHKTTSSWLMHTKNGQTWSSPEDYAAGRFRGQNTKFPKQWWFLFKHQRKIRALI